MPPPLTRILGNPFGVTPQLTAAPSVPVNAPLPGTVSTRPAPVDTYDRDQLRLTFSTSVLSEPTGGSAIPPGRAMTLSEARAFTDARLAAMSPDERADIVVALSHSIAAVREQPGASQLQQEALRVLRSTLDATSLNATFDRLIQTRELGFVVDQVGLTRLIALCNYGAYNLEFNAIAARSDTVRERGMTMREREYSSRIFGSGIDYDAVRFRFTRGTMTSGAEALVLGNTVHVDPSTTRFTFRPGTTEPDEAGMYNWSTTVLAHELTHVWQYQHIGSSYAFSSLSQQISSIIATGDRNRPYEYQLSDHRNFSEFGIEQQAMIVENYDQLLREVEAGRLPRTALRQYQPFIDQLRAAGRGVSQPVLSPEQLALLPADSPLRNMGGGDGVMQGVAALFPGLAQRIGSEAFADMMRGQATGALLVAAIAALSYQRGSVVLEEFGVPNTMRLGTGRAGISLGARYGAHFANAAGVVGFDANGRIGNATVSGDVQATINQQGIERAALRLSARGDGFNLDAGARLDPTGIYGSYRLLFGGAWSDGNVALERNGTLRSYALRGGYSSTTAGLSAGVMGDAFGVADLRVSASGTVGAASLSGNLHLGRNGVFQDASLAGSLALSDTLTADLAAMVGPNGLSTVRGGLAYRAGADRSLRVQGSFTPAFNAYALDLIGEAGAVRGFVRASTSDMGQSLTLGVSGNF